jgi:Zn-dependent protease
MLLFGIGWAKPVPINPMNFDDRKKGMAISAAAGPISNILLATVSLIITKIIWYASYVLGAGWVMNTLYTIFSTMCSINISLAIFNLLPIPPFDGSRLLYVFLPSNLYFAVMKHEKKIYYGVLAWLLLGDYVAMGVRMLPFVSNSPLLYWFAGIFSLSDMISFVIQLVINLIIRFWSLIFGLF